MIIRESEAQRIGGRKSEMMNNVQGLKEERNEKNLAFEHSEKSIFRFPLKNDENKCVRPLN